MSNRSEQPPVARGRLERRRRRNRTARRRHILVAALAFTAALVVLLGGGFASQALRQQAPLRGGRAAADAPRPVDLSHGRWELRIGATASREGWVPTRVPGVFDPTPERSNFYGTVGWYRLRFVAPRLPPGFHWALRFEQVKRAADVWLNGRHLGHRGDGSLPFTLPARGLRPGRENLLAVRVDSRRGAHLHEAWWNWGGIIRDVWLIPRGPARLEPFALLPHLSRSGGRWHARVMVSGRLRNRTTRPLRATIQTSLTSPGGTVSEHVTRPLALPPGGSRFVRFSVPVRGRPALWMPGRPRLYHAAVRVSADEMPVQDERSRIGLRSVRVAHGLLFVNGRRLSARGASVEEDLPGEGAALDASGFDRLVADLKRLHADITRVQYLPSEGLLDKLDAAGIMLWSQAAVHVREADLSTPAGRAAQLRTVRATLLATRNHPSVIVHSVANELAARPDQRPGTRIFLRRAAALARRLDPAVPAAVDVRAAPGLPRQYAYDEFPVLGLTTYFGWYRGLVGNPQGPLDTLGAYLESMRLEYPNQAMMVTEFGAEAVRPGPAWLRSTYGFQAGYLAQTLSIIDREPWLAGAICFTARDFPIKPFWGGGAQLRHAQRDVYLNKGLLTYTGVPKPAAAVARSRFAAVPTFARR
jgi:Glycosyl hydrolases family 2/Glycosyl hydrolases family 2, TIM barrel domain/Glycosyl hydrolases family 2, sugar binding domain